MLKSDIAVERHRADLHAPGVKFTKTKSDVCETERLVINSQEGAARIGRPIGTYVTLNFSTLAERDERFDAQIEVLCDVFAQLLPPAPKTILCIGLGNRNLTTDALGPLTADGILPTRHIEKNDANLFRRMECCRIFVCAPGTSAQSGMDASELIHALSDTFRPEAIIAIDSLATSSAHRLGKTVQICDTGIAPGEGVGNRRPAIEEKELGIPVISVGVPTVIDADIYAGEYARKHGLPHPRRRGERLFLSPRDIDDIVKNAGEMISSAINRTYGIPV